MCRSRTQTSAGLPSKTPSGFCSATRKAPSSTRCNAARGALFETWVVGEFIKQRLNAGRPQDLYFWRDNVGHEVDLIFETPQGLQAVEIKSGSTFASDWPQAAHQWQAVVGGDATPSPWIIFGGEGRYTRQGGEVWGWRQWCDQD